MLPTDSYEYEILFEAAKNIKDVPGLVCEIGLRAGGGTSIMISGLLANEDYNRTVIAIDPYGNIDYATEEGVVTKFDYTNDMRNQCMREMHAFIRHKPVNFLFFPLEDTEFFKRYSDGVPVYEENKRLETKYALVHFDGPHIKSVLENEIEFFGERSGIGSRWVFDDIDNYDHMAVEEKIYAYGFERAIYGTRKASYVRTK